MGVPKKKTKTEAERNDSGITASYPSLLASGVSIEVTWKHVVDLDRNTLHGYSEEIRAGWRGKSHPNKVSGINTVERAHPLSTGWLGDRSPSLAPSC